MEFITRSIYSAYLQSTQLSGLAFAMVPYTTLNEKFSVLAGVAPSQTDMPRLKYLAIGNGGHDLVVGAGGVAKIKPSQYKTTNAALYNHLPFALKLPEADFSDADRAKYGLRRLEAHNGTNYIAYYLRRIDFTSVQVGMNYHTVNSSGEVVTPFIPDSTNLNPVKPPLSSTGVNLVSGDYVSASAPVNISFSANDVAELINVAEIIYSDADYAIISELGLVSGVDKVASSPGVGAGTVQQNEVICAQLCTMINVFYQLNFNNQGIEVDLDLGATEPLFKVG